MKRTLVVLGVILILAATFFYCGYKFDENPPEVLQPLSIVSGIVGAMLFLGGLLYKKNDNQ